MALTLGRQIDQADDGSAVGFWAVCEAAMTAFDDAPIESYAEAVGTWLAKAGSCDAYSACGEAEFKLIPSPAIRHSDGNRFTLWRCRDRNGLLMFEADDLEKAQRAGYFREIRFPSLESDRGISECEVLEGFPASMFPLVEQECVEEGEVLKLLQMRFPSASLNAVRITIRGFDRDDWLARGSTLFLRSQRLYEAVDRATAFVAA